MTKARVEWKSRKVDETAKKEQIAQKFVLHEDNELVGPNLPFYYCRINANKVIDGLFVGNQDAAHDLEFLLSIKCKYVINCAGTSVPNLFSRYGIKYLTFRWFDSKTCAIFDSQGKSCRQIHKFISNALERGNAVLVHSVYGDSRACLAIAAYLMLHFKWSVKKCLEFVAYKRPETNPKPHFIKQLLRAAKSLQFSTSDHSVLSVLCRPQTTKPGTCLYTHSIIEAPTTTIEDRWCITHYDNVEEAVVTNTFLNSHTIRFEGDNTVQLGTALPTKTAASANKRTLRWNPNLVEIFNETPSGTSGVNTSSATLNYGSEKPLTSILKVRPSTPALPVTSKSCSQSGTDSESSLKSAQTSNYMKVHDNDSSQRRMSNQMKQAKPVNADELDSTLSSLSDTINTLRVGRKSITNQAFTGAIPLNKTAPLIIHNNNNSNSNNNNNNSNSNNNTSSLWSSSRTRSNVNKGSPSLLSSSLSFHDHHDAPSALSQQSQISALRVIGRSNDAIKASRSNSFNSSLNQTQSRIHAKSSSNVSHRLHKSASRKKQRLPSNNRSGLGIRKGPAPLYAKPRTPIPAQTSYGLKNRVVTNFGSNLSASLPVNNSSAFPARRLVRVASEDRISTLKSQQFKSRLGANNLSSTKSRFSERPRSAPKTRPNKKTLPNTAIRQRSNSARSKLVAPKNITPQFRRVGW